MFRRPTADAIKTAATLIGVVALIGLGPACSECDSTPCEEDCDETYPSDERARTACYTSCQQAVADCSIGQLEPELAEAPDDDE